MKEGCNGTDSLGGFIRARRLSQILGVSRSTIWRLERAGILPPKISITGSRSVGWRVEEIQEFLKSRRTVDCG